MCVGVNCVLEELLMRRSEKAELDNVSFSVVRL